MTGEVQLRERLAKDPSPEMVKYIIGPKMDEQFNLLFEPQMQIHLAHCIMLRQTEIISKVDASEILRELLQLLHSGSSVLERNVAFEDLFTHIEHHLISKIGADVAGQLHTGRSRNDIGVTVWRMVLRGWLLDVRESLLRFWGTLIDLAEAHAETIMPGYTHSQHAQPMTLGYYFAAFADLIQRDVVRLDAAFQTNNRNPLGAAALTTTGFPIDREMTTRLLGFSGLVENGFDSVASRDDAEEAACVLAILGTHLGRFAEDLFVWHTAEFGFIEFDDDFASVSSIMPQKKNPGLLEYTKKHSGYLIGGSTQVLAAARGAWFTDANDATDAGNDPLREMSQSAISTLEVLSSALQSMSVNPERMEVLARDGYGTMTELADTIVREAGVSFRVAHNIVGRTVALALEKGLAASEITLEMLESASDELTDTRLNISPKAIQGALDPAENIRRRNVVGGPALGEMRRMIKERRATHQDRTNKLAEDRRYLSESLEELLESARQLVEAR